MPVYDNLPDLTHWKTVQEFSITQAALLLAGIDPFDFDEDKALEQVRARKHERWKLAWGMSAGIITAIRRGVLTPILCFSEKWVENWNGPDYIEYEIIKPTDRSQEISKIKTIMTRDSLMAWIESECIDIAQKPRKISHEQSQRYQRCDHSEKIIHPPAQDIVTINEPLALPSYEHRSEGLEYVDEAIKQFWSTYDEDDPSTAPKKDDVTAYLQSKGASGNVAKAVDLIVRPDALRNLGRRKNV
ncbi:hypothetical protein PP836_003138 [Salmonella enterica]|nr:hypothetical protein [Salmonella enterica subsp. diarizonae]EGV3635698.1 hypothetical protein [Salmonella enterica]EKL0443110.1 hypothetical protein [Salmonella enterica]HCM1888542.1 hypothetical protein [Salmonella enterica subsp. diarizonae serovar 57:c:z]